MNENDLTQHPTDSDPGADASPEASALPVEPALDAPVTDDFIAGSALSIDADPGADVDAALAAVASLSLMSDRDADDMARGETAPLPETTGRRAGRAAFPAPPLIAPRRGSLGAIVAGLLCIAGGGYWTFLNLTGTPPGPFVIAVAIVGGVVVTMLAAWLAGGRWARGLLFAALTLGGLAGALALFILAPELDIALTYPLLLAVPGAACLFTALLGRPVTPRLLLPAAALIMAAVVGVAYNAGLIPPLDLAGLLPPA